MSKYNLLIDCSFIRSRVYFPVSTALYAGRLLQGFKDSDVFSVVAIVCNGMEDQIDDLAGYSVEKKIIVNEQTRITPRQSLCRVLGIMPFKAEMKRYQIDAVLMPEGFDCWFFFPRRYNHHVIIQDMIRYKTIKDKTSPWIYWPWRLYRRLLYRNVRCFISISQKTREELKHYEGKDSVVVYNSIPFDFSIQEKEVACLAGKKYILDVNRFQKYKNAETLIRAFNLLKDRIPHILYLKGDDRHSEDYEELVKLVNQLGLEDRVIFDRTHRSESEIRYMYTHADLFVTPSLMEGFGWTPIEAAILKVPVLTSNTDVMREVSCGKLSTFDPYSPEDLAEKMEEMLKLPPDEKTKQELSDFFIEKYSLKNQIEGLTNVLLNTLHKQ